MSITWQIDDDIVHLVLDAPGRSANTMDAAFLDALEAAVERAAVEQPRGIVLRSAKKTFVAGADLDELAGAGPADADRWRATSSRTKAALRRLETAGVPVVAVIAGAALGGGLELALAAHRRIAVDDRRVVLGFPEVTLGLLPGAGGVVRSVRLLGPDVALDQLLLRGQRISAAEAVELGIVDELAPDADAALAAAVAWIRTGPEAVQPWDVKGYVAPGTKPRDSAALTAALQNRLRGANYPAPKAILAAAIEGLQVDVATASAIEERYFVDLVTGPVSTNMVQAFFFDRQAATRRPQPAGREPRTFTKAAVLGAGMMGAGIAHACASSGMQVVLVDTTVEKAERGKAYSAKVGAPDEVLARITATDSFADAAGADVVIEAVFEDPAIKGEAFKNVEPYVAEDALLASNTSTLPISGLAEAVQRPEAFLGMHFFSPVNRMELVEIIRGRTTGDEALLQALDLTKQIGKVPIVVNDSRGFFTSRTYTAFTYEGMAMLGEGVPAPTIEQAALQAGFPAPILQMMDEVTLTLPRDIREAARLAAQDEGRDWHPHPADAVLDTMIDEHDRKGRTSGGAFYEFVDNKRVGLWPGLREVFGGTTEIPFDDAKERLLFIGALQGIRSLEEGVLERVSDANIGSILGIGYPGWTGGVLQFVNTYPGGLTGFAQRCHELAQRYGDRFTPPRLLLDKAQQGSTFQDEA